MKKTNVVMIVADQWRADSVGYNGNSVVNTPNIDDLANEGVAFSNAYCQNPVCVPSRASFLTGWYPHTKGFRTMHHLMGEDEPNLLKTLKNSGYHVYWGGRNDVLKLEADVSNYCSTRDDKFADKMRKVRLEKERKMKEPQQDIKEREDYSLYRGVKQEVNHPDVAQMEDAVDFIENKKFGDDPFCIYLALSLPHPAYLIEQEWYDKIDAEAIPDPVKLTEEEWAKKPSIMRGIHQNQKLFNWSDDQLKELKHVYYAMGTKLDHYIGAVVDSLKEQGLYDDTIFIFFSDHGDYTGDYQMSEKNQNTFEDCLTRVPLVIKPAKNTELKARKTDALVELIDIQATILDLLNIEQDHSQFGKSLQHVLAGEDGHRDVVFCEGGRLEGESHAMDAGHTPDNEYWARTTEQEKIPQHTKAMMLRDHDYKYVYRLYEKDEFYDLNADPYEKENKIDDAQYNEKIQKYKNRMLRHFFETGDVVPFKQDKRF